MNSSNSGMESEQGTEDTSRMTARDRSRVETHRRLIDAGRELFVANGLARTTAAEIARKAGVATGTFYIHFKDKEALLEEAWEEVFQRIGGQMLWIANPVARLSRESVLENARTNAEVLLSSVEARADAFSFWFGPEVAASSAGEKIVFRWAEGIETRLRVEIAQGAVLNGVDPTVAAQAIVGMFVRTLLWWVRDKNRASREAVITTLTMYQVSVYSF
ncbi:MAG: TetR/AcrR family transcriptional regulator [Candidatus Hydrogenedentes bacterium]|nr:TetR/AcrR family transcriptional regulator [Candidatus Hydrogenedentota bacterium]